MKDGFAHTRALIRTVFRRRILLFVGLLLVASGIVIALQLRPSATVVEPLVFLGYTNRSSERLALFEFDPRHESAFFNVYSWSFQTAECVSRPLGGQWTTNEIPSVQLQFIGSKPRIEIPIPETAAEFYVVYRHRENKGRTFGDVNSVGRSFSVGHPSTRACVYESERLATALFYQGADPKEAAQNGGE